MWSLIGIIVFLAAAIALETAFLFWDFLPALKRMGLVHSLGAFFALMAIVCLLEWIF